MTPQGFENELQLFAAKLACAEDNKYNDDADDFYNQFLYEGIDEARFEKEMGFKIQHIRSERDEGDGNYNGCNCVFMTIRDGVTQYFRIDGWYSSYEGRTYDGDWYEVVPVVYDVYDFVKVSEMSERMRRI